MFRFYFNYHWFFSIFGAFLLLVLSLIPAGPLNPLSWIKVLHIDKVAHILAYFIWSFALIFSFSKQYKLSVLRYTKTFSAFTIALFYGMLMEVLQATLSSNRVGEWPDVIANSVGCCLGLVVFFRVRKMYNLKFNTYEKPENTASKH